MLSPASKSIPGAESRIFTASTLCSSTAEDRAFMPSPSAAFTSAPILSSVRREEQAFFFSSTVSSGIPPSSRSFISAPSLMSASSSSPLSSATSTKLRGYALSSMRKDLPRREKKESVSSS